MTLVSQASVFTVCRHCNSSLFREQMDLRLLGEMAALIDDPTVFQIGTTGLYRNEQFTILGRVRQQWSDGVWNEWYIYFGGDKYGWLAEAQGFLMVNFPFEETVPDQNVLQAGAFVQIGGVPFEVLDRKEVLSGYAEGELPLVAKPGEPFLSIDLVHGQSGFACITYSRDGSWLYLGEYVEFDELKFQNLREIDGW